MQTKQMAEKVRKILSGLKFNYLKEEESELGKVDFGVLTVAMMVAALDGVILPEELKAFSKLADKCRISRSERAARYEAALHSAGYILLMSRSGLSEKALAQIFVREAEEVLPCGFAGGRMEDIRRALVIWVTMGLSDGTFSGIERTCVKAFCAEVAAIMKARRDCRREKLWLGLCPGLQASGPKKAGKAQEKTAEPDLMALAEQYVAAGDAAAIRAFIVKG